MNNVPAVGTPDPSGDGWRADPPAVCGASAVPITEPAMDLDH